MDAREVSRKLARIVGPRAVLAFSGGMDSGFLAWALADAGVELTLATVVGPHISARQRTIAVYGAAALNLPQVIHELCPVSERLIAANDESRCYYCKKNLFELLGSEAGIPLIDGTNADDDPMRPGRRAAREFGVVSPLEVAGLTKREVGALAASVGAPGWDCEPDSCLATRIRTGTALTHERLELVEAVESVLLTEAIRGVRARLDDMMMTIRYCNENGPLKDNVRTSVHALCREFGLAEPEYKPW